MLVKGKKKEQVEEVDGDPYRYFLLAGTSHPYPDDTFYSVGRVPRKLLMKYLGVKMYLVTIHHVSVAPVTCVAAGAAAAAPGRGAGEGVPSLGVEHEHGLHCTVLHCTVLHCTVQVKESPVSVSSTSTGYITRTLDFTSRHCTPLPWDR